MRSFSRVVRSVAAQQQARQFSVRAAARPSMLSLNHRTSAPQWSQVRFASGGSLAKDDIKARVLDVLKSFEKVDPAKVGGSYLSMLRMMQHSNIRLWHTTLLISIVPRCLASVPFNLSRF
jgi:hypothetical protein